MAGAKQKLGIKNSTEDDLYLLDMVNAGVKRLRNLMTFVQAVAVLPIDPINFSSKLPPGFVRFNKGCPIVFTDAQGQANQQSSLIYPVFINNPYFTQSPFLPQDPGFNITVNIVNGYLFFSSNVASEFCKVSFLSTNLDNNGDVQIPAIAEDTLVAFCCWNFCRTYRMPEAASYEYEYKKGRSWLKGLAASQQSIDEPYTSYLMNKLP